MAWTNDDGLEVRFGTERTEVNLTGRTSATPKTLTVSIPDATKIVNSDETAVAGDDAYLPAGAVITSAYLVVDTAFTSGGAAVLDIGLKQLDGTSIDDNGIFAGEAVAGLTANAVAVGDGILINTRVAQDAAVAVSYDAAVFTAGAGKLVVNYIEL